MKLPINFAAIADQFLTMFGNILASTYPLLIIIVLFQIGLKRLTSAFQSLDDALGGQISNHPFKGAPGGQISSHPFKKETHSNDGEYIKNAPEWVRERHEWEAMKENIERKYKGKAKKRRMARRRAAFEKKLEKKYGNIV